MHTYMCTPRSVAGTLHWRAKSCWRGQLVPLLSSSRRQPLSLPFSNLRSPWQALKSSDHSFSRLDAILASILCVINKTLPPHRMPIRPSPHLGPQIRLAPAAAGRDAAGCGHHSALPSAPPLARGEARGYTHSAARLSLSRPPICNRSFLRAGYVRIYTAHSSQSPLFFPLPSIPSSASPQDLAHSAQEARLN